jgi:hypothetical protein
MSTVTVHVRLDEKRVAILDKLRAAERTHPSRNALAAAMLSDALDDSNGTGVHAVDAPQRGPGTKKAPRGGAR